MGSSLHEILAGIIRTGSLTLATPQGERYYGDGTGRHVGLRLADDKAAAELAWDPQLKLGELYMDGRLLVEEGDVYDLLALIKENSRSQRLSFGMVFNALVRIALARLRSLSPFEHNRRNVAHHYDLDARLFSLFLDADWQYSCAFFNPPELSLEEAQRAKKRHIAAKLLSRPGQKVLEIGSGWGGMALYLAETGGLDVTGITLSEEQLKVSRQRATAAGLAQQVRFELRDYAGLDAATRYDRIVSVGMFEHVGRRHYRRYFSRIRDALAPDGVALVHSIGQPQPPLATNPWLEKYIFPGGYIPSLSEVLPAVERSGLLVADIEIWPLHYGVTLNHWRRRFLARRNEAAALYDERFVRMWEFYLAASEMAFTHEDFFVFQLQLVKRRDAVPASRDYMAAEEARLLRADAGRPHPVSPAVPPSAP